MLYAIVWFAVLALLSLWSLVMWALHGIGVWTVTNADTLGGVAAGAGGLDVPAWLAPWLPPEVAQALPSLLATLEPGMQALLHAAPALAGGLTVAAWVVWAAGSVLLVVLGAAANVLIAVGRRRRGGAAPRPHAMVS